MVEYNRHIDEYLNYPQSGFSDLISDGEWGRRELAEKYLQKYWLEEVEYQKEWKAIQNKIFKQDVSLPDLVFRLELEMIALRGGCLFVEEDFMQLQKVMQEVGDKYFVVVQDSQEFTEGEPMFRMKFPVNITWDELISGNYISSVLLEMTYNNYFVFGDSGRWGKYSATDYEMPLDIIGFEPEYGYIFKAQFKQSSEEWAEIRGWLPSSYKEIIK